MLPVILRVSRNGLNQELFKQLLNKQVGVGFWPILAGFGDTVKGKHPILRIVGCT